MNMFILRLSFIAIFIKQSFSFAAVEDVVQQTISTQGQARVMIEKVLLGDTLKLQGLPQNVLEALRDLLDGGIGLRSKRTARRSQTDFRLDAVKLKHITRAANSRFYVVYIQFLTIRMFSQPTPSLDEAINWHLALFNWESQARKNALEKHLVGSDAFKAVTEEGLMNVLQNQPSLVLSFQLMSSTHQRYNSPRTPDFRQCVSFHRDYFTVRESGGEIQKIKPHWIQERNSIKSKRQQRYRALLKDVKLEIGKRAQMPTLIDNRLNWGLLGLSRPRLTASEQMLGLGLAPLSEPDNPQATRMNENWGRLGLSRPRLTASEQMPGLGLTPLSGPDSPQATCNGDALLRLLQGALHISVDDVRSALPSLWALRVCEVRRRWLQLIRPAQGIAIANIPAQVSAELDVGLEQQKAFGKKKLDARSQIGCYISWLPGLPIDIAHQVSQWLTIEEVARVRYCASRFIPNINAAIVFRLEIDGYFYCNPRSELFCSPPQQSSYGRPLRHPSLLLASAHRSTSLPFQPLSKNVVRHILAFLQNRNFVGSFRQLDLSALPASVLENVEFHECLRRMPRLLGIVLPKHGWSCFAERQRMEKCLRREVHIWFA